MHTLSIPILKWSPKGERGEKRTESDGKKYEGKALLEGGEDRCQSLEDSCPSGNTSKGPKETTKWRSTWPGWNIVRKCFHRANHIIENPTSETKLQKWNRAASKTR